MFGVSSLELLLIFVIGLLILGPERLPRVAAQIGRWVAKARRTANQLRYQLEREVALDELYKSQKKQPPKRPSAPPAEQGAAGDSQISTPADEAAESPPGAAAPTADAGVSAASTLDASAGPPPPPVTPSPQVTPSAVEPAAFDGERSERLETTTADAAEVGERR